MNILVYFVALTAALIVPVSCGSNHKQELDLAEALMEQIPDSSLRIVERIKQQGDLKEEEKARAALLHSMALDKTFVDTTKFDVLQPAIDFYLRKGSPDNKLRTLYYQGRIYQNIPDRENALMCFIKGKEIGANISDSLTYARLLVAEGSLYFKMYEPEPYAYNNLEASRLFKKYGKENSCIETLGNAIEGFLLCKNYHKADSIYQLYKEEAKNNPFYQEDIDAFSISIAVVTGEMERLKNVMDSIAGRTPKSKYARLNMARAYSKLGDNKMALNYLTSVNPDEFNESSSLKYWSISTEVLKNAGDYKGALEAYEKFSAIFGIEALDSFEKNISFTKSMYDSEIESLETSQRQERIIWICVAAILVISGCFLAGFIILRTRHKMAAAKSKLEEEGKRSLRFELENRDLQIRRLESEKENLSSLLEAKNEMPKDVAASIRERIGNLNSLLACAITNNGVSGKNYDSLMESILSDRTRFMNSTRLAFKASHPDFIGYFESRGLTDDEINYLCLYALGLRGKDVGEYLHLRRHYTISSEIRKKLDMTDRETNIGIFVRKLLAES